MVRTNISAECAIEEEMNRTYPGIEFSSDDRLRQVGAFWVVDSDATGGNAPRTGLQKVIAATAATNRG